FVGLYNTGSSDDTLQSVTSPGHAASVTITGRSVGIPASGPANLTGPEPKLVLKNLTQPISGGQDIPVTFDFAHAGAVTLDVPVEAQADEYATFSPPAAASPQASGTAQPSGTAKPTPTPSPSK
ncbi:MAG: copper chaperone PCu(A)C, partial [Nocardiopsaceae bacterium]|nr:copper chaperone PCu(A)C [Nocardiopsaceae bacterium]